MKGWLVIGGGVVIVAAVAVAFWMGDEPTSPLAPGADWQAAPTESTAEPETELAETPPDADSDAETDEATELVADASSESDAEAESAGEQASAPDAPSAELDLAESETSDDADAEVIVGEEVTPTEHQTESAADLVEENSEATADATAESSSEREPSPPVIVVEQTEVEVERDVVVLEALPESPAAQDAADLSEPSATSDSSSSDEEGASGPVEELAEGEPVEPSPVGPTEMLEAETESVAETATGDVSETPEVSVSQSEGDGSAEVGLEPGSIDVVGQVEPTTPHHESENSDTTAGSDVASANVEQDPVESESQVEANTALTNNEPSTATPLDASAAVDQSSSADGELATASEPLASSETDTAIAAPSETVEEPPESQAATEPALQSDDASDELSVASLDNPPVSPPIPSHSPITAQSDVGEPETDEPAGDSVASSEEESDLSVSEPPAQAAVEEVERAEQVIEEVAENGPVAPSFDAVRVNENGMVIIAGRAAPGAMVTITSNGGAIGTAEADDLGEFVFIGSEPLAPGDHEIGLAEAADEAAQPTTESDQVVLLLVPEPNLTVADLAPSEGAEGADETGALAVLVDRDAVGPTEVLQAPAAPAATPAAEEASTSSAVEMSASDAPTTAGETSSAQAGEVLHDETTEDIQQSGVSADGEGSGSTRPEVVENVPVNDAPAPAAAPTVSIDVVDYDDDGRLIIAGRAQPGAVILIYLDNQPIGRATAAADGRYWLRPDQRVVPGLYTLRADQVDDAGAVVARAETPFQRTAPLAGLPDNRRIVVQPGNNLWRLARSIYGQGVQYTVIYQANRTQIRDPDLIYPGQVFVLPAPPEQLPAGLPSRT
ncbi:MAG: LysM peptidoglycan-binding domain-containing protein [Pseudomonadota bacterium]